MSAFPGLPPLVKRVRVPNPKAIQRPRGLKMYTSRSLNYMRIKEQVEAEIARLPGDKQRLIPPGTLPERMVALALVQLGYEFSCQNPETGGRLRLGGSVVDFKVYLGSGVVLIRVMGSYWHSLADRIRKDAVQWQRLHALKYRVCDLWEGFLYQAWVDGRLKEAVNEGILNAS